MLFNIKRVLHFFGFSDQGRGGVLRARGILNLSALTLAVLLPTAAVAQSGGRDRDPALSQAKNLATQIQSANYHWGPLYLLSQFQLSDVGYGYDYYVPAGEDTQGVSVAVAAPQKLFFIPRKKLIFTAEATPAYSYFFGNSSSGQFDYELRGDAHLLLNHVYLNFYVLGTDKLRPQAADFNRVATVKTSGFGTSGEVKYSSRTSLLFSGLATQLRYPSARYQPEDVPVNLLERDELSGRVALLHKTFPLTSLRLAVEAADYQFPRASYQDAFKVRVAPGIDYDGSRVDVQLEAGPTRLSFDDPAQEDFSGLTGNVGIRRSRGRWTATAAAARDLSFSIMQDNAYFITGRATAGLEYAASSRLTLRANTTAARDDYPVAVREVLRRDQLTFSTVGFRYRRWRLTGGIDVGQYTRTSTLVGDDESGIRYVVDLSFTP